MSMPLPVPTTSVPAPSTTGCRLVAADGRQLPLREVRLVGQAGGGLASTVVHQVFHNPFDEPLAVTYTLPLPADGAVTGFQFTLDEQTITGVVETKKQARETFEQAVLEGRTAALLEQDRSSLFRQELGNVPPGATITCAITVEHGLAWREGGWEWRFPTVVAPRFLGTQTPDADRVSVDVLDGPAPVRCALEVRVADRCTGPVSSPSHVVHLADGAWSLGADAPLDRDVVLRWPVAAPEVGVSVEVHGDAEQAHALLTVVPPTPEHLPEPVPRDLILLLDISGSMGGRPIEQLKAFSRALVRSMGPADRLEALAFASSVSHWRSSATPMTPANQADALAWLERLRAGGGTHMHTAILEALKPLRPNAQRQVVLVSDGLIGFEQQIIGTIRNELPAGSRVHTIGVGSGVNRSLTGPSARAGAGIEVVVGLDESVEGAVRDLLARTAAPAVVELSMAGKVLREVAPMRVPDLFAGSPVRISLAVDPAGGPLTLSGKTAAGAWSHTVTLPAATEGRPVLATRYARERVEDLELEIAAGGSSAEIDPKIEALGLAHQIATRLTSWVAATTEATVDPGDPTRAVTVPQSLPYGLSAEGVGLRSAAPMQFAMLRSASAPPPAPQAASMPRRRIRMEKKAAPKGGLFQKAKEALFGSGAPGGGAADDEAAGPSAASFDAMEREEAAPPTEALAPEPEEAERRTGARRRGRALPRMTARIRVHRDGTLVLEVALDADHDWEPGTTVTVVLPDGSEHDVTVASGTTRAGRLHAGQTARLVLDWSGPAPSGVWLANLVLDVR